MKSSFASYLYRLIWQELPQKTPAYLAVLGIYLWFIYDTHYHFFRTDHRDAFNLLLTALALVLINPLTWVVRTQRTRIRLIGWAGALALYINLGYYPETKDFLLLHRDAILALIVCWVLIEWNIWQWFVIRMQRLVASMMHHLQSAHRLYIWCLTLWLSSVTARAYLLLNNSTISSTATLRGVGSDMVMSVLTTFLLVLLVRSENLKLVFALLWAYLLAANIDMVDNNATNLLFSFWRQGAQETFILSSALSNSVLVKALFIFALMSGVRLLVPLMVRSLPPWLYPRVIRLGTALCCLPVLLPLTYSTPNWAQQHWLESNLHLFYLQHTFDINDHQPLSPEDTSELYQVETPGQAIFPPYRPDRPTNILMLLIEGLSGQHVKRGWMPNFTQWTQQGLYYENMLVYNRITSNGLYAIICGDMPQLTRVTSFTDNLDKLITHNGKVTAINAAATPRSCLPNYLRDLGYHTTYMQSAPLTFMEKDRFMPLAGYEVTMENKDLPVREPQNDSYGAGDDALFESVWRVIQQQPVDKPWFVTALTVGTHHPFMLSDECRQLPGNDNEEKAFRCADTMLDRLLTRMKDAGMLENTLVIVTADEARISTTALPYPAGLLTNNHSPLLLLTPDHRKGVSADYVTQADIPLSVLEYLGKTPAKNDYGRSLFHKYNRFRPLYFANHFTNTLFMVPRDGQLLMCNVISPQCQQYTFPAGRIFGNEFSETKPSPVGIRRLRAAVATINLHLPSIFTPHSE